MLLLVLIVDLGYPVIQHPDDSPGSSTNHDLRHTCSTGEILLLKLHYTKVQFEACARKILILGSLLLSYQDCRSGPCQSFFWYDKDLKTCAFTAPSSCIYMYSTGDTIPNLQCHACTCSWTQHEKIYLEPAISEVFPT